MNCWGHGQLRLGEPFLQSSFLFVWPSSSSPCRLGISSPKKSWLNQRVDGRTMLFFLSLMGMSCNFGIPFVMCQVCRLRFYYYLVEGGMGRQGCEQRQASVCFYSSRLLLDPSPAYHKVHNTNSLCRHERWKSKVPVAPFQIPMHALTAKMHLSGRKH